MCHYKSVGKVFIYFCTFLFLVSCRKLIIDKEPATDPVTVFEYLWKQADEKYAYFDYKKIDWNLVHDKYRPLVYQGMSQEQLFDVLARMLNELKDGHVNLFSSFNISNYYPVFLNSPENFSERVLLKNYLLRKPESFYITGSLHNTILDTLGIKVGYIRYSSFMESVSDKELDYVLTRMAETDGIIIDVRNNGGGNLSNVPMIGQRFINERRKISESSYRKGPDKSDFESRDGFWEPAKKNYTKRVAVLTNRGCYSATSFFALAMRTLPHVRLIGDTTGGGLGMPNGGELPNGWTYRFSVTRTLSIEKDASNNSYNWEDGVPPNITTQLDKEKLEEGIDTIIERAIEYIKVGT